MTESLFPGGSKSRVNRAGEHIRSGTVLPDDVDVIDTWRAAHRGVLNTFQAILRNRTKGERITVAQRHKRRSTIFDKLFRMPKMQLSRMDDVAGCRLIFSNVNALYEFRNKFLGAHFKHRRLNDLEKYDYIKRPKNTGYRGIHDIYEYHVNSKEGEALAGLLVEIQYRTLVQHAWATAVEVVGFITESQPKFQKGDKRYEFAMALASEIIARAHEATTGPFPQEDSRKLVGKFLEIDKELGLLRMLKGLKVASSIVSGKRNAILIFSQDRQLETRLYKDSTEALKSLFELEKSMPGRDIVLVRADSGEDMRLAFRNYFSDAKDFIELVTVGCRNLTR